MPTNYNIPTGGTVNLGGYLGVPNQDTEYGIFPSVLQQGGFQEMPTLQDMYEIPVQVNGADIPNNNWGSPVITDDGWGSGRRRVGMFVYVLENQKLYSLIPDGYFGNNGGNLGVADWNNLTDAQKYELLDPTALYNAGGNPFAGYTPNTPTGTSADCWVELQFGGKEVSGVTYNQTTGILSISFNDGSNDITAQINSGYNEFEFLVGPGPVYKVGQDSEYQDPANNSNPTLYVDRGETYIFRNSAGTTHPINIKETDTNGALITAGKLSGTFPISDQSILVWQVGN